jgi:hypothetical protein
VRRWLAVTLVALAACGGGGDGDGGALDGAGDALAEVESGTVHVRMETAAGDSGPVGFDMAGRFARGDGDLPILDLTATRLLGDSELATEVLSTGDAVFVTVDGTTYEVPDDEAEQLAGLGLGRLDVADWVLDPEESDGEEVDGVATRRITGRLDVAELLADLAAVEGRTGGDAIPELDDEARDRLRGLVREDEIEVLVGADDGIVRRVRASAELAGQVPAELQDALGAVTNARLQVLVELSDIGAGLEVAAPPDAEPLPG